MKIALIAVSVVAIAAAVMAGVFGGLYFTDDDDATAAAACGDRSFGHIAALTPDGDGYRMRFDPEWFTSGETANDAAAEDGAVEPGEPVPNDNYRVDEGHRLLTYLVPADTPVTVVTREGEPESFGAMPITVAQLAQLVDGEKPVELYEPLDSGVWSRVDVDTVCSIDQQYLP